MNVLDIRRRQHRGNYYTIADFMVATGLSRAALLQIINGRPDRGVPPLVPKSQRSMLLINNRWTMMYSEKAFVKVMDSIAKRKVDKRYKDNNSKRKQKQ